MRVIPEECNSFQNRFEGCAYTKPVTPVIMPGLTPTRRSIKPGGIVSRRRDDEPDGLGGEIAVSVSALFRTLFRELSGGELRFLVGLLLRDTEGDSEADDLEEDRVTR